MYELHYSPITEEEATVEMIAEAQDTFEELHADLDLYELVEGCIDADALAKEYDLPLYLVEDAMWYWAED